MKESGHGPCSVYEKKGKKGGGRIIIRTKSAAEHTGESWAIVGEKEAQRFYSSCVLIPLLKLALYCVLMDWM